MNHIIKFLLLIIFPFASLSMDHTPNKFPDFLIKLHTITDSSLKSKLIHDYLSSTPVPIIEDNNVYFIFYGDGKNVAVPGEMNRWDPSKAIMNNVEGTKLFYRVEQLPINGRVEYKLWVDSVWMLDPRNPRKAEGGFGENSDLWMPEYVPPRIDLSVPESLTGTIDTLLFESQILKRHHPVYIYVPSTKGDRLFPTAYITDGGDYLHFGKMNVILDNLIATKIIQPIIAVFIDSRTDPNNPSSNMRMLDYSGNDTFLDFLERELIPTIEQKYPVSRDSEHRLIVGTSMGGLIGTYAVLKRPHMFNKCAVQSPAYLQANSVVVKLAQEISTKGRTFFIQTGTINDTEIEGRQVAQLLRKNGGTVRLEEAPEGHNWTNWRARIPLILEYYFQSVGNK